MKKADLIKTIPILIISMVFAYCGGGQGVQDDSPVQEIYPSSVEMKDAETVIAEANNLYTALGNDGTIETGKAKEYLDKAREYASEKEPEPAWAAAVKSKSFSSLSATMKQVRAAGLK